MKPYIEPEAVICELQSALPVLPLTVELPHAKAPAVSFMAKLASALQSIHPVAGKVVDLPILTTSPKLIIRAPVPKSVTHLALPPGKPPRFPV
jgi:hypothetical protein